MTKSLRTPPAKSASSPKPRPDFSLSPVLLTEMSGLNSDELVTKGNPTLIAANSQASLTVNPPKAQFIKDLELAGLNRLSIKKYLNCLEQITRFYWKSPLELTEKQVEQYLLHYLHCDPSPSSLRMLQCALRFFYTHTLDRNWRLFKKKYEPHEKNVCRLS